MLLLHVSDIHFRSPDCLDESQDPDRPFRTRLLHDVQSMVDELGPVGAILIGGDVAFKGASDEYATALIWIRQLSALAGCPPERVFVVPGNHDVDRAHARRSIPTRNAQRAIRSASPFEREREFRSQILDSGAAQALLAPHAAFNEFAAKMNCQVYLPERLYWKQDLVLGKGVTLRIHGLTSTLLSGSNGDDDERGALYLSPLQTVLDPANDVVNLVLCHHPPDWLMDSDDADDAICARAQLQMFGHRHRQRIQLNANYIRFSAGAVNPDRSELNWSPGYNFVSLSIDGVNADRRLVVNAHLRQWQVSPEMFRPVLDTSGSDVFSQTIRFPGRATPEGPPLPTGSPVEEAALVTPPLECPIGAGESAMGDPGTRNLVYRFWNLTVSQRRDISITLGLIEHEELALPEPERYGRALIRASERGLLSQLAQEVAKKETP